MTSIYYKKIITCNIQKILLYSSVQFKHFKVKIWGRHFPQDFGLAQSNWIHTKQQPIKQLETEN